MKSLSLFLVMLLAACTSAVAQVGINADNSSPDPSAMLDVKSISKGFLAPRMTLAQMGAIVNPANGLIVFCTNTNKFYGFVSGSNAWREILFGTEAITPGTCGSVTVNHVAGTVAPVNKTVTYGTVTNIPGEPLKCWITSNLGASHQATAVDDATEESAGWYWQFNRRQGYKHDGSAPTPAWTIFSIIENSDWLSLNDPCSLELGPAWRIPTNTEWSNVSFYWVNWNYPWNSALKLHAAGEISLVENGVLAGRGSFGFYWSSKQNSTTRSWYLSFYSELCAVNEYYKAYGHSLRCIRD
jgi:hypothetical protein